MGAKAFQITSLKIVYSTVYSSVDHRKHQSSASLAFVRGIHRWPMNSPHKWPVTRKMFPFDDVIMNLKTLLWLHFISKIFHICTDIYISCIPAVRIDNKSLVQVIAWCLIGKKPMPELMATKTYDNTWHWKATENWAMLCLVQCWISIMDISYISPGFVNNKINQ